MVKRGFIPHTQPHTTINQYCTDHNYNNSAQKYILSQLTDNQP